MIAFASLLYHFLYRRSGDSVGGVIELVVRNVPSGIGSPVFDKIEADLAKSCLSLPAAKGFEVCLTFRTNKLNSVFRLGLDLQGLCELALSITILFILITLEESGS